MNHPGSHVLARYLSNFDGIITPIYPYNVPSCPLTLNDQNCASASCLTSRFLSAHIVLLDSRLLSLVVRSTKYAARLYTVLSLRKFVPVHAMKAYGGVEAQLQVEVSRQVYAPAILHSAEAPETR